MLTPPNSKDYEIESLLNILNQKLWKLQQIASYDINTW